MYLIPVPALTDNDLCLLHDGKPVMVVNPVDAGLAMAARNVHSPDSKSILVTHHHGGYKTSIPPGNGQYVRSAHGRAVSRRRQGTWADLHLALMREPDNHGIAAVRGIDSSACTALSVFSKLTAIGQ